MTVSRVALVRARILSRRGRVLAVRKLGLLRAGENAVKIRLPRSLRGGVRVVVESPGGGAAARAVVRVTRGGRACKAR